MHTATLKGLLRVLLMSLLLGLSGCETVRKVARIAVTLPVAVVHAPISLAVNAPHIIRAIVADRKELEKMPLKRMFPDKQVQALAKAAAHGRLEKLEELAAQGIDVNTRGAKGATPLFWALREGNVMGFTKLLELGADPNIMLEGRNNDTSIMHWATEHEDVAYLQAALEHGGNPNLRAGRYNKPPLLETLGTFAHARKEHRRLLLAAGADPNGRSLDAPPADGAFGSDTPVMEAAYRNRYDIVYELLEAGADYKIRNIHGLDLPDLMARHIEVLVSGNEVDKDMEKAIDWLSHRGVKIPAILKPLEAMFPGQQARALAKAAADGDLRKLEELAAQGIDVNARGIKNATPLVWALHKNNLKGFIKLLELGADPNILLDDGGTVMHWAARHENTAFLRAALEHGGSPNLRAGQFNETPLFSTIGYYANEVRQENMQLLLASGADIDAKAVHSPARMSMGGNTPAITAAQRRRYDVVYELLKSGADHTVRNDDGDDLSNLAAQHRRDHESLSGPLALINHHFNHHFRYFFEDTRRDFQRVIGWLSDRGVQVPVMLEPLETMFPDQQARALARAAEEEDFRTLEQLVAQGVDVNARGWQNATPLLRALHKGNLKGFKKLLELGADPNIVHDHDRTVMHWAARHEDIGFLRAALEHGGNPNVEAGPTVGGKTPLFDTFSFLFDDDRKENRQLLLASGAYINAVIVRRYYFVRLPNDGNTPAMTAALKRRYDIVYELLEAGTDYKIRNAGGDNLSNLVAKNRHDLESLVDFIAQDRADLATPRQKSLQKVIDWLWHRGVKIPVILKPLAAMFPDRQVRALAKAAAEGDLQKLEEAAAQGIDVNARGWQNATPLLWALHKGNLKGFTKLLALGADPNILFDDGGAVMHWAARHEDIGYLQAALQHGGNPNLQAGQFGETPLFDTFGDSYGDNRIKNRQLLLASGADIDARTVRNPAHRYVGGNTPVMSAMMESQYDVVHELLEAGAGYEIKNEYGEDLMYLIRQKSSVPEHFKIWEWDLDAGADYTVKYGARYDFPDLTAKNRADLAASQRRNLTKVIDWLSHRGVNI